MVSLHRKVVALADEPERKERIIARVLIGSFAVLVIVILLLGTIIFLQVHGTNS
ncbi:MAG TPA: hypothetical protein VEK06_05005 [Myxococcota bacterium]|nr:hypothetical protein [Myxococcota bacterium]